MRNIFKISMLY